MESLYYNLSEEEFSKGRKTLLWVFGGLFFLSGIYILIKSFILGHEALPAILSLAPFGISLIVFVIAVFATIKRTDLFFAVNEDEIEFKYGIINPRKYTFKWSEIIEVKIPHKQKKAMLLFRDGSTFVINLTWLQKKKSSLIRKHIYYAARSKDIKITKVKMLG